MSWGEVKKINSDLSVPLDERASYVGGVIRRNVEKRSVEKDFYSGSDTVKETILDISGSGALQYIQVFNTAQGTSNSYVKCKIQIDNNDPIEIKMVSNGAYGVVLDINTDVNSIFTDVFSREITVSEHRVVTNSLVTNTPLVFKNQLKLSCEIGGYGVSKGFRANYGLT